MRLWPARECWLLCLLRGTETGAVRGPAGVEEPAVAMWEAETVTERMEVLLAVREWCILPVTVGWMEKPLGPERSG